MKSNGYIKPPRMSMNFSENKVEIKKRFRNILDNSGKSSGKIMLALVCVVVIFAGLFIAFSMNKNEDGKVENNKTSGSTAKYNIGKEVSVDLNGDGIAEKIYYGLDDFKVNDVSYKNDIIYMVYENSPMEDYFIIADTDENDSRKEIVLRVDGPSADPEGIFFTYDGNKLVYCGSVPSDLDVEDFDGKGNISGNLRLDILQTWWAPAKWELDDNGNVVLVEQDMYYPYQPDEEYSITLTKDLPVHEKLTDSKQPTIIPPQKVKITRTDNKQFCYIEAEDGKKGWFFVEDFAKLPEVNGEYAYDVFENLCMAD